MTDETTRRLLDEVAPRDLSDDKLAFHGDGAEAFAEIIDRRSREWAKKHKAELDAYFKGATPRDKPRF